MNKFIHFTTFSLFRQNTAANETNVTVIESTSITCEPKDSNQMDNNPLNGQLDRSVNVSQKPNTCYAASNEIVSAKQNVEADLNLPKSPKTPQVHRQPNIIDALTPSSDAITANLCADQKESVNIRSPKTTPLTPKNEKQPRKAKVRILT